MRDFTLHDVLVEPALNALTRAGRQERLSAKFVDVLVALAESPGQVIGKTDLLARVWGNGDTDEKALAHAVWVLRKALNDDAASPRFIATVPRRGYRLLAPVVYAEAGTETVGVAAATRSESSPLSVAEPSTREASRAQPLWTRLRLAGALLAVAAVVIAISASLLGVRGHVVSNDNITWIFRSAGEVLALGDDASTVLFGDESGFVYALDAASGREQWRFATQGAVHGVPRLADGSIYVGSDDGYLYALDALSGRERWRLHVGARIQTAPVADAEGTIFFGAHNSEVAAVTAVSGERRWTVHVPGRPFGALLRVGEMLVSRLDSATLVGIDRHSGALRWQRSLDRGTGEPVALDATHVAIAGFDAGIAVIDVRDGGVLWQQPVPGLMQRPIADANSVVVVNAVGDVAAFAASDGHLQWRRAVAIGDPLDPVAWHDWLVVPTSHNRLALLNRLDGGIAATLALQTAPVKLAATDNGLRIALNSGVVRDLATAALGADVRGDLELTDSGIVRGAPREDSTFRIVHIAANAPEPELLWRVPTRGFTFYLGIVDRERVVIGDDRGVSLLDAASGVARWQYALTQPTGTEFVYDAGALFFGSRDHRLHALDAASGHELWSFATGDGVLSTPALANERVFFGSRDKNFYALDRRTGAELWRFATAAPVHGGAAAGDGVVVFGSGDSNIYALDQISGKLRWRFAATDWVVATPLIADGVVYIGDASGVTFAIDLANGSERWRHGCAKDIWFRSAVDAERLYFGCGDGYVYALARTDGTERWRYRTQASATGGVALRDGVLYAGSFDHSLHALDAASGKLLWRLDTGGQTINPQVADGRVYVTSADQHAYALRVPTAKRQ